MSRHVSEKPTSWKNPAVYGHRIKQLILVIYYGIIILVINGDTHVSYILWDNNGIYNHGIVVNPYLVGGFNPSEKYEFVSWDDEIPNILGNKRHVPNHQPAV